MFDLVINNGSIVDPVDGEYEGNIGIKDGKIATVSTEVLMGEKVIDAERKKISPGFIDIHMHEDKISDGKIVFDGFNCMALMGVTTCVGGNCGLGLAEVSEYKRIIDKHGSPVNYAGLTAHGLLRESAGCHDRYRPSTDSEINKMACTLREGLDKGSIGLSVGIEYIPGVSTEEIIQLSRIVAEYGNRIVSIHYRFDCDRALEAVAELIIIARESGVKLQISHLGSCAAFGKMTAALEMINAARKAGVNIGVDAYPYDAFCTYIGSTVFDPGFIERLGVSYEDLLVTEGKYQGKRCTKEIFDYIREHEPKDLVVVFAMGEKEVIEAISHPLVIIASDGHIKNGQGHPRGAGTFPRVLGRYVRENKYIDLISAIDKMTHMPAKRLALTNKGRIKEGYDADITIFDYEIINDTATYEEPTKPPFGIESVIVNGVEVVDKVGLTGKHPGVFLVV